MKHLSRPKLAKLFLALYVHQSPRVAVTTVAKLMVAQKQTREVDLLLTEIKRELFRQTGHLEATVTTARPQTPQVMSAISQYVQTLLQAKSITLHPETNKKLLGGVVITTPDYRLDASIRKQLQALERTP